MDLNTKTLCDLIRTRSRENRAAFRRLGELGDVLSPALSILRQEAASLLMVVYLLSLGDIRARQRLIDGALRGSRWTVRSAAGRLRDVTNRDLVGLAGKLAGYTKEVYRFGCGIVRLSELHDRLAASPFGKLGPAEKADILAYLRRYHGGPEKGSPELAELLLDGPRVLEKISGHLELCLIKLERDETLDEQAAPRRPAAEDGGCGGSTEGGNHG